MNGNQNSQIVIRLLFHLLQAAICFCCLLLFLFFIYHFLPSDLVETILAKSSSGGSNRQLIKEQLGLNQSLSTQLGSFLDEIAKGRLGTSLWTGQSVSHLISERVPATLAFALPALLSFILLGTLSGFFQAFWKNKIPSKLLGFLNSVFFCIPAFSLGAFLARTDLPVFSTLLALSTYVVATVPTLAALVQRRLLEEEQKPYAYAARAKGLSRLQLFSNHLLRSCIPLVLSLLPWWWSMFLGTAVVVEPLFRLDGLGFLAFEAFRNQDVPVLLGLSLLIGSGRILLGLIRDLLFELFSKGVPT